MILWALLRSDSMKTLRRVVKILEETNKLKCSFNDLIPLKMRNEDLNSPLMVAQNTMRPQV